MLGILAGILLCSYNAALAEDLDKGKTFMIMVGFGPGGGYELMGRLLSYHLGRFIPGSPNAVVANMHGPSGIKWVNYLYSMAPRDGTVLGTFPSASPFYKATHMPAMQYKSAELLWIGNLSCSVNSVAVWHATRVPTLDDAKTTPVVMAALAGAGIMDTYPRLLNNLFGTKLSIVAGARKP
jgi:tripartite-type tricarboxylate transporter receptor subunit TctC